MRSGSFAKSSSSIPLSRDGRLWRRRTTGKSGPFQAVSGVEISPDMMITEDTALMG